MPVNGYDAEPWNEVTDYVLHDPSGNVLAVVEAKRCSRNPREADEQLQYYITEIAKHQTYAPFGFMINGLEIWFWEVGQANPRLIAGFFSPQDLQWVIVGGESGHKARPMRKEWVDGIQRQRDRADVAFFFKQWGAWGADGQ